MAPAVSWWRCVLWDPPLQGASLPVLWGPPWQGASLPSQERQLPAVRHSGWLRLLLLQGIVMLAAPVLLAVELNEVGEAGQLGWRPGWGGVAFDLLLTQGVALCARLLRRETPASTVACHAGYIQHIGRQHCEGEDVSPQPAGLHAV